MPETQTYQLAYWIAPDETAVREAREVLARKIKDLGGEILSDPEPAARRLSYPIKKQREGYFGILTVKLPAETPQKLHNEFARDAKILRLMIVRGGPSLEMRRRRTGAGVRSSKKGGSLKGFDQRLEEILKTQQSI